MIFTAGIPAHERENYKRSIRRNCYESMQVLIKNAEILENFEPTLENSAIVDTAKTAVELTPEVAEAISDLWTREEALKRTWTRRNEFWILDAAQYYFDNAIRLADAEFEPNEEDCLMARVRTTGMAKSEFEYQKFRFTVVDVGGQKSERRKWINFFDNVNSVIFVVSLIEYNQVMFEDPSKNRMRDSMELFESIISLSCFRDTTFTLFLNKKDLFETMTLEQDLSYCFPDYTGGYSGLASTQYIIDKFKSLHAKHRSDELRTHVVSARVRMDMKVAFKDVSNTCRDGYMQDHAKKPKPKGSRKSSRVAPR